MKDVDHKIDVVEDNPPTLLQSFGVGGSLAVFGERLKHMLCDSPHVGVRRARRDDEVVRHVGDAVQVEDDDVIGFVVEADRRRAARQIGLLGDREGGGTLPYAPEVIQGWPSPYSVGHTKGSNTPKRITPRSAGRQSDTNQNNGE